MSKLLFLNVNIAPIDIILHHQRNFQVDLEMYFIVFAKFKSVLILWSYLMPVTSAVLKYHLKKHFKAIGKGGLVIRTLGMCGFTHFPNFLWLKLVIRGFSFNYP